MHRYTEANAEFQRLYALSLEDAGYTPPSSRNATATSEQSRPPWNPALTTTLIAWTWGGHSGFSGKRKRLDTKKPPVNRGRRPVAVGLMRRGKSKKPGLAQPLACKD